VRYRLLAIWTVLACGDQVAAPLDAAGDAAVDAPPDPFAGRFDDPSDFPHGNCTPGALAGFAHAEIWFELGLRTTYAGGQLRTFLATYLDDAEVPHLLTTDDLVARNSTYNGQSWSLTAIDVCGVDADGTLHGAVAHCQERPPEFPSDPCWSYELVAAPFRRIPGEATGDHLTLLGEFGGAWPGTSTNVRVDGDLAFLSRFDDGLRIVSIANPAAPVEVGHLALSSEWANDLEIVHSEGRRYIVTASVVGNVIDATDPTNPQLVAELPFGPHSVFIEGTTAYLVDGWSSELQVWDLARPRAPRKLGAWTHPQQEAEHYAWHDVFVAAGIAYLSDINGSGMHVVDLRDPLHPVVLGGETGSGPMWHSPWLTTIGGRRVAINGTEFSEPGMRLLDGDPASPTFLAKLGQWSLVRGSAHNLMAIGPRVYMAHYRDGIRIIDASTPASPTMIGYHNTWILGTGTAGDLGAFGIDLDPVRKRIYVADSIRGLLILQGDATVFP